jgi:hypothetical protein
MGKKLNLWQRREIAFDQLVKRLRLCRVFAARRLNDARPLSATGGRRDISLCRDYENRSVASARGGKWTARAVLNVIARLDGDAP